MSHLISGYLWSHYCHTSHHNHRHTIPHPSVTSFQGQRGSYQHISVSPEVITDLAVSSYVWLFVVPVDVPKRQHLTQQGIPNIKAHLICISLKTPCYVWPARTAGTGGGGCGADQIRDCAGARLYKAGVCWLYLPPHIPGGHHPPCCRVQSVPYQHYTALAQHSDQDHTHGELVSNVLLLRFYHESV